MNYETSADAYIRPLIGLPAQPAHATADKKSHPTSVQAASLGARSASEPGAKGEIETSEADFSFYDLLDVINPLQHIPGISTAYREFTGDEIKAPARILGGFLLGGPIGFVAAIANSVIEESSGQDMGEAALAMLFGDEPQIGEDLAENTTEGLEAQFQAAAGDAGNDTFASDQAVDASPKARAETPPPAASMPQRTAEPDGSEGLLTGQAALSALYSDMMAKRHGEAAPAGEQATAAIAPEAANQQVPPNLIGLGIRDRRSAAHAVPAVSVPAARLVPAATQTQDPAIDAILPQPARSSAAPPAPSAYVPGPHVPGSRGVDPSLFVPPTEAQTTDPQPIAATAPEDFSAQMLQALTKYEHMLQERQKPELP